MFLDKFLSNPMASTSLMMRICAHSCTGQHPADAEHRFVCNLTSRRKLMHDLHMGTEHSLAWLMISFIRWHLRTHVEDAHADACSSSLM